MYYVYELKKNAQKHEFQSLDKVYSYLVNTYHEQFNFTYFSKRFIPHSKIDIELNSKKIRVEWLSESERGITND